METKADSGRKGGTTTAEDFKNPLKVEGGRKGGTITLERYGRDQLTTWGKLGGRPRSRTYDEIRQQQRLEQNNNGKEVKGPPGSNLSELKKALKLRDRSSPNHKTVQAGMAQETPREPALPERTQS